MVVRLWFSVRVIICGAGGFLESAAGCLETGPTGSDAPPPRLGGEDSQCACLHAPCMHHGGHTDQHDHVANHGPYPIQGSRVLQQAGTCAVPWQRYPTYPHTGVQTAAPRRTCLLQPLRSRFVSCFESSRFTEFWEVQSLPGRHCLSCRLGPAVAARCMIPVS